MLSRAEYQQPSLLLKEEGSTTKVYRSNSISERPTSFSGLPLCLCGCGRQVTRKRNKWLKGHNRRQYPHELPLCACGCGQLVNFNGNDHVSYIRGHYMKIHPCKGTLNGMYGKVPWNRGLTKSTDLRVAKNAEGTKRSWLTRDRREIGKTYSRVGFRKDLGVCFKSRWEANIARVFNFLGVEWQYEPKVFDLDELVYAVDFYLPGLDRWVEVKGWWYPKSYRKLQLLYERCGIVSDLIDQTEYVKLQRKFSIFIPEWEFDKWTR